MNRSGAWAGPALVAATLVACGQRELPSEANASDASPMATPDLTGVWASESRYMDVGIPITLNNTDWAPLSSGSPEERQAQSFEEQSAWYTQLLEEDADIFAVYAMNAFRPPYSAAGEAASAELGAARDGAPAGGPYARCLPQNVVGFGSGSLQIMQSDDRIVTISEDGVVRTIFTDGRSQTSTLPSWTGHSVASWQDTSLTVRTVSFQGQTVPAGFGMPWPMSLEAAVSETLTISDDQETLAIKIVYEDPVYLTEPVARMVYLKRQPPDYELIHVSCLENVQGVAEFNSIIGN